MPYERVVHMLAPDGKSTLHGLWKVSMTISTDVRKVTCPICIDILNIDALNNEKGNDTRTNSNNPRKK